jgi:glycosyltransferase involved in cell wall biosynthesis
MSRAPLERSTVAPRRAGARLDDPLRAAPDVLPGIAIVLPCLDEQDNVAAAVSAATRAGERVASACEVIVVDDGSADATAAIAARLGLLDRHVRLVRHERNRGYGAAVRTGIATARQPWVFLTDADMQFDLEELDRFAAAALGGGGAPQRPDLVIGWRVARSDPFARRVEAAAWNWLVRRLFALPFRDVDCAFKLMRRDVVVALELRCDGAAFSTELLSKALAAGAVVEQIGVSHYPRVAGRSSGGRPRVVVRAFRELWALRGGAPRCAAAS